MSSIGASHNRKSKTATKARRDARAAKRAITKGVTK